MKVSYHHFGLRIECQYVPVNMWSTATRSIPIVSKLDYTHSVFEFHGTCGTGEIAWNTVASSPFAKKTSVESWDELPLLLDKLWQMSDDDLTRLQVTVIFDRLVHWLMVQVESKRRVKP